MLIPCFAVLMSLPAFGQSASATLSGTIQDQNSAALPGVVVTIVNDATSLERTATTNADGAFTVPLLLPGTYTLTAKRDGFTTVRVPNVVLNVGDQKTMLVSLKVGDINAAIDVRPDETLVDTSPAVITTVDRTFVANIPLSGRTFHSLITLTPGVVLAPSNGNVVDGAFVINGQRGNANIFSVDGVSANAMNSAGLSAPGQGAGGTLPALSADGGTNSLVSIDALQEFSIQTSTYAAEFGRSPGGQISFVTRSGENKFHGTAFEYFRDDMFDANNWFSNRFGLERSPLKQHDFGGTFSGPVFLPRYNGKNKTFFFFSYEGLRLESPKFAQAWVPSVELRQSAAASVQPILNAFPTPNGPEAGDNMFAQFNSSYSDTSTLNATSVRVDHAVNDKLKLFGRVNKAPSSAKERDLSSLSFYYDRTQDLFTLTTGGTYAGSSKFVNDLRFNYTLSKGTQGTVADDFGGAVPIDRSVLIPSQFDSPSATGSVFIFSPDGLLAIYNFNKDESTQTQYNLVNTSTFVLGRHELKLGIDFRRLTPVHSAEPYVVRPFFESRQELLDGIASRVGVQVAITARPVYTNFSAFGQDTWRVSPRLTLSYGLRWELNPAPGEAGGNHPIAVNQISDLSTTVPAPLGTPLWKTTYTNFAPRFGASYLLSDKAGRETVVRGGFGLFYDTGGSRGSESFGGFPFSAFRNEFDVEFPLDPSRLAPPDLPDPRNLVSPYSFLIFDPDLKLPYTWQWNMAVEQSLGKSQSLSASYVGAIARGLIRSRAINLAPVNSNFGFNGIIDGESTSSYHAMQLQFQRRLSRGLQMLASYTWSHSIDDQSSDFSDQIVTRGNSSFDLRHNFNSAVTYDIPIPKTNQFGNALLRGWSLDTRINVQSAFPLNITTGFIIDPNNGVLTSPRANVIPGVPLYLFGDQYPGGRIINNTIPTTDQRIAAGCDPVAPAKGAFCTPLAGGLGNLGRNSLRGLPTWQVDMALRRQIKLRESIALQLRAEAFNVFNHPNFGAINRTLGSSTFGLATNMLNQRLGGLNQIYQAGGPRSMQFAAKLIF